MGSSMSRKPNEIETTDSPPMANPSILRVKFYKIRLDRQGYEQGPNPRYWGIGLPLYRFYRVDPHDQGELAITELRASDRRVAKDKFLAYAKGRAMGNVEFLN
jgi:hypothetical protein